MIHTFCALDTTNGRSSVPPEQLLLASLLQSFYGIRSGTFLEKLMAAPELKPLSRPKPPSPVSQGQRRCARWRAPARRRAGRCLFTICRPASISAELIEMVHLAGGSWCAGHGNTSS
jgi:hypothetical protein